MQGADDACCMRRLHCSTWPTVRQVLEHMGWQTAMAENGLEALEQVAQFKPHLVCMDRHMPVRAGCHSLG